MQCFVRPSQRMALMLMNERSPEHPPLPYSLYHQRLHLCPGLHANAKIANFAKNRKEEDKSPTTTRDFYDSCENCEKSQFSQKSLKSQKSQLLYGTCVL